MRGVNRVTLVGSAGSDPEVRYGQSGAAITSLSIATNERWKDKDGNQQERTEWHRLKFFGRLAEIAGEYLKKGSLVYIEGSLRTEKYTDKNGVEKYSTDIIVSEMQMLGGGKEGEGGGGRGEERPAGNNQRSGGQQSGGGGNQQRGNAGYGRNSGGQSAQQRQPEAADAGGSRGGGGGGYRGFDDSGIDGDIPF